MRASERKQAEARRKRQGQEGKPSELGAREEDDDDEERLVLKVVHVCGGQRGWLCAWSMTRVLMLPL